MYDRLVAALSALILVTSVVVGAEAQRSNPVTHKAQLIQAAAKLPLSFEANAGQTEKQARFLSRGSGYTLFLTSRELVLSLRGFVLPVSDIDPRSEDRLNLDPKVRVSQGNLKSGNVQSSTLRITLSGANPKPTIEGTDALPGKSNYFIGNDPRKWRTSVPSYAKVKYHEVYPGVDLVYYGNKGQLEHDFVVSPGVNAGIIRLKVNGARQIAVDDQGDLRLRMPGGEVTLQRPIVYQEVGGIRQTVSAQYALLHNNQFGFRIGSYDTKRTLIIDPVLVYATYLGGGSDDFGPGDLRVDSAGNAYVCGTTYSPNFPTSSGVFQSTLRGGDDTYVLKLNPSGSALVYSTYIGGDGLEGCNGLAIDGAGNAYLAIQTNSTNFPTTSGAFQQTWGGGPSLGVVAKLNTTGSALLYSTYLGGTCCENGPESIAVDGSGNAYVAGFTQSPTFPTTAGAYQATYPVGSPGAGFLTELNATGTSLIYSTFFGGSGATVPLGVAVDSSGNAYVSGSTTATDLPTTAGAFQTAFGGGNSDAFVAKLDPTGSTLVYSTFVGGSGDEVLQGIVLDATGNAYATGYTTSSNFPVTAGAYQTASGGGYDVMVIKLNPAGTALMYSTYLGGPGLDVGGKIAVDSSGKADALLNAYTGSFPTTPNAIQGTYPGGTAAVVAQLDASGSSLLFSSYVGGSGDNRPVGIGVNTNGDIYFALGTDATNAPTVNPIQPTNAGAHDLYLAKISIHVYLAAVQQPINADGSSVFSATRGVIPVKFTLTMDGVSTCTLPTAAISLTRTTGAVVGAIDESVYEMSADTGSTFRISGCQYIYNLSAKSLGPGTYEVDISIGGSVVGSAVFALK